MVNGNTQDHDNTLPVIIRQNLQIYDSGLSVIKKISKNIIELILISYKALLGEWR